MKLYTHAWRFLAVCLAAAGVTFFGTAALAVDISGAGATFPYPVYAQWANEYNKATGVKLNYQSIGSGGGIAQIKAKTVDFGASDAPLKPEDLQAAGLIQWPQIMGGVIPVVNVPGVAANQMKLTPEALSDIYLGKITKWNDPAVAASNPGMNLPDKLISVVRRSDGSGTSFLFTNYLSKVNKEWSEKVGFNTSVSWPVGLGGKGNEGVANYVKQIENSIGYVELAYALQNKMATVSLKNKAGKFVEPSLDSFAAAAANADWAHAPGNYLVLTDQPGEKSWPITGASFILMHKDQAKPETAKEVLKFFAWTFDKGDDMAKKLDYVPIPTPVVKMIEKQWKAEVKGNGKSVW